MQLRIKRIPHNWVLQELRPGGPHPITGNVGPDHWEDVGFYGQLCDLARAALNRSIIVPEGLLAEQMPALIKAVKEAEARLASMLTAPKEESPN